MADRVFPNSVNVDMGSKLEFSGIDWSAVQASIANNRFADAKTDQVVALLANAGYDLNPAQVAELDGVIESVTGGAPDDNLDGDENLGDNSGGMDSDMSDIDGMEGLGGMDMDMSDDDEFEEPTMGTGAGMFQRESNSKNMKRIAFTSQKQISADAIESALAKGDTKLVNTILAARKENRNRIAAAIKEKADSEMNKSASKSNSKTKRSASSEPKNKTEITTEFTSPTKFTRAQRDSFKKIAIASGMPKEYVDAMCGVTPLDPKLEALSDSIKKVYSLDLASNVKQATIKTLIKEAKLSPDSKSEFINYWNEVLGYQDKAFWPDVAADYTAGKKTAKSNASKK